MGLGRPSCGGSSEWSHPRCPTVVAARIGNVASCQRTKSLTHAAGMGLLVRCAARCSSAAVCACRKWELCSQSKEPAAPLGARLIAHLPRAERGSVGAALGVPCSACFNKHGKPAAATALLQRRQQQGSARQPGAANLLRNSAGTHTGHECERFAFYCAQKKALGACA